MKNIELFNLYVAKIFDYLYDDFPIAKDIDICEFIGVEVDPFELQLPKECKIFEHTMYFLKEEGFIDYKRGDTNGFFQVRLTLKGLSILKKKPKALKASFIESIKHWIGVGNEELIKKTIDLIFEGISSVS